MTRKDFELIAEVLAEHRASQIRDYLNKDSLRLAEFEMDLIANRFAGVLATTNPAFDRDRFLKAAGVRT